MRETVRELSEGSSEVDTINSAAPQEEEEGETTESEPTLHQNTLTEGDGIPTVPPPPRRLYHPDSFLSQSTGQELPSQGNHSASSSMIFHQSGVNLNTQRSTVSSLGMTRTNSGGQSQQVVQRQSSYLSFNAPERSRGNIQPGFYQQSRLSSHTLQSATPVGTPISGKSYVESSLEHTPPSNAAPVGNPEDDMDFSSFLNSSQPQASNRTQQKLWLQRETIASQNDSSMAVNSPISNISTRFKYEEVARSYMHIRRTGNPITESLKRVENIKPNHFKVRKPEQEMSEDVDKLKATSSDSKDIVDVLWKKAIDQHMTLPPKKPAQKLSANLSSSPGNSASNLFHMGQRSFGSQQKLDSALGRPKFGRTYDNTTSIPSPLSSSHRL